MRNRFKVVLGTLVVLFIICFAFVFFSPYKTYDSEIKEIRNEILICKPIEEVFTYLGNSKNASKWSVFVKDIIPLNADTCLDGSVNSIRRCFVKDVQLDNAYWDEVITEVKPNKKRQLAIYNFKNFTITAGGLLTEQIYDQIGPNETKLIFRLFYKKEMCGLLNDMKTYLVAYRIHDIFKQNLSNIKIVVEIEKKSVCSIWHC